MGREDLCGGVRVGWKVVRSIWCTREQRRCVQKIHRNLEGEIMQSTIGPRSKIAKTARRFRNTPRPLLAAGLFAMAVPFAHAGAELKILDPPSVTVRLGLRASFTSLEHGAPDGTSDSKTFAAANVPLYST